MTLKVVYHNPNASGGNIYFLQEVRKYMTKNRELHIWLKDSPEPEPIIFAVGQWICAEPQTVVQPTSANGHRRRQSTLSDLTYPTPEAHQERQNALAEFAVGNQVVPWSDRHMQAVLEYEKLMESEYGPDAVKELPWNKVVARASDGRRP